MKRGGSGNDGTRVERGAERGAERERKPIGEDTALERGAENGDDIDHILGHDLGLGHDLSFGHDLSHGHGHSQDQETTTRKSVHADTGLKVVTEGMMITEGVTVTGVAQDHENGATDVVNTTGVDHRRAMAIEIEHIFNAEALLWRQPIS